MSSQYSFDRTVLRIKLSLQSLRVIAPHMSSNRINNPGDICRIKSVFLHDPIHQVFALAEDRLDQRCLPSEVVANRENAEARIRGKNRPCIVLNTNPTDGSCSVALFFTVEGRDIDEMPFYYRCHSLAVYPTTKIPSHLDGNYPLLNERPLHTKPEWTLQTRRNNPTEFKDQWVLALPLQLTKKDTRTLHPFKRECDGGNVNVDLAELTRFRKICHITQEFFLEKFQTPAALALASTSFMVCLLSSNLSILLTIMALD